VDRWSGCRHNEPPCTMCGSMDDATFLGGIVRIEIPCPPERPSRGTGFIVRIQRAASGADVVEILTALHVIADLAGSRARGKPVWLGERTADLRLRDHSRPALSLDDTTVPQCSIEGDWALIRLEVARPHKLIAFKLAALEDRLWTNSWRSFGYSAAVPVDGEPLTGDVTFEEPGLIHLHCEQAAAGAGGRVSGCSGAPSVVEGHVVGLISLALQKDGVSIHGAVYAHPIGPIAAACQLPLAPGPQVFQSTVETLLAAVQSTALIELARALDVPVFPSEAGLRLRVARALLLADDRQICAALAGRAAEKPEQIAVMALTRALRDEAVDAVRACQGRDNRRGIVALASKYETARLLVARALGSLDGIKRRITHVDTHDPAAWPLRLREALATMLGNALEDFDDDAALADDLPPDGVFVAFPCDPPHAVLAPPLAALAPFASARPLALLPADKQGAWEAVADYPLVPVLCDAWDEKTFLRRCNRAANYFKT